jgi:hypothetical protein
VRAIEVRIAIDNGFSRLKAILQSELDNPSFGGVLTIWPNPAPRVTPGTLKLVWLKALNSSARNCTTPLGDGEVLAQIEIEVEHSRGTENADTGLPLI